MLQPIIEGETAHFFEEIKVCTVPTKKMLPGTCHRELKYFIFVLNFCFNFRKKRRKVMVCLQT